MILILSKGLYHHKKYRLIMERRFALLNDPKNYAGGSVSSW
jgi:hypothetical protein